MMHRDLRLVFQTVALALTFIAPAVAHADFVVNISLGNAVQVGNQLTLDVLLNYSRTNNQAADVVGLNNLQFSIDDLSTSDEFDSNSSYSRILSIANNVALPSWQANYASGQLAVSNTDANPANYIAPGYNASIATLTLDVSLLPTGNYNLGLFDGFLLGIDEGASAVALPDDYANSGSSLYSLNPSLTFNITAVPEPTGLGALVCLGVLAMRNKLAKRRQRSLVST